LWKARLDTANGGLSSIGASDKKDNFKASSIDAVTLLINDPNQSWVLVFGA
jgi:hypothetical protein